MKRVGRMSRSGIHETRDRKSRSGIHEKRWSDVTEWYTCNALVGCHGVVHMKRVTGSHGVVYMKCVTGCHGVVYTKSVTGSRGVVYKKNDDRKSRNGIHEKR